MNIAIKPLAAAVSLALISVSAHAAFGPPTIGSTAPTDATTTYLSIWDSAGNNSEIVNLTSLYADIGNPTSGNFSPNAAGSGFVLANDPSGGSGKVLSYDFGIIPGFSTIINSGNIGTADYMVTNAVSGTTTATDVTSSIAPITTKSGLQLISQNIQSEIATWQGGWPTNGYLTDTTGSVAWSVQNGALKGGGIGLSGQNFGGAVGTSLAFYNFLLTGTGITQKNTITQFANGVGDGFWFMSTNGDLSYNVPAAVPLPAAVWLLGSGLLGLAGIGRRRRAA